MAETQVLGWGTQNAPASRTTHGTETFELLAVDATFDGTGAGGNFVPAVQIVSDAGVEVGTFPLQETVTAGDSRRVTFAPFLRSSTTGSGIQFVTDPQSGTWLFVTTTGTNPGTGNGLDLIDTVGINEQTAGPFNLQAGTDMTISTGGEVDIEPTTNFIVNPGGNAQIEPTGHLFLQAQGQLALSGSGDIVVDLFPGGSLLVRDSGTNPIFKVNENGDLQGKTGKALTFNL